RRRAVTVEVSENDIAIAADGQEIARWPHGELYRIDGPRKILRVGAESAPELARLEVRDPALQNAIAAHSPQLGTRRRGGQATAAQVVFWSMAAVISLVLTVIYLVPLVADRLAPFVPIPVERRLGEAVDSQVRAIFGGEACSSEEGDAALARLSEKL